MTGTELNVVLAAILLAFGVAVPMPAFAGGFLIALGCAYGVRAFHTSSKQKGIALTLFIGGLVALLAAILHPTTREVWVWGGLAVQAQMAIAGALSQSLAETVILFGGRLKDKIGLLPDSFTFPGGKDEPK